VFPQSCFWWPSGRSGIFPPRHALVLELIALAGFFFFSVVWLIVAVATPAPVVVADVCPHTGAPHS